MPLGHSASQCRPSRVLAKRVKATRLCMHSIGIGLRIHASTFLLTAKDFDVYSCEKAQPKVRVMWLMKMVVPNCGSIIPGYGLALGLVSIWS